MRGEPARGRLAVLLIAVPGALLLGPAPARPQSPHGEPGARVERASTPISVDGRLDEEAWRQAPVAGGFLQRDPNQGEPATEATELRLLFDDGALYVGARLHDREPAQIVRQLSRRDVVAEADSFSIFLDPHHDHLTGVELQVSAAGVQRDSAIYDDNFEDDSWDAVWESAVTLDAEGWTLEMRIPFSQLRFPAASRQTWGVNARRVVQRKHESSWLALVPKNESGLASRMAHLEGIAGVPPAKHLELLPYLSGRAEYIAPAGPGDPFNDGSRLFGGAGLDLKYGFSTNLAVVAAINPDFGQVEVDPAVVNLTAFETFFEEKRPFFTEGAQVFSHFGRSGASEYLSFFYPEPQLFYSRRIGRAPQGSAAADFVDAPDSTTILGAAKLTGRTRSGWTVGVLEAVTGRETARLSDGSSFGREEVEPLTNYFVGRVRRDYRQGNTVVGGLATAVNRDLSDPALKSLLRSSAYAGGLDLNHYWGRRRWSLDAMLLGSTVQGDESVIAATQQRSSRYFQRPDAKTLHYDPTRTSLSGYSGLLSLNKIAGKHGQGSLTYQDWSPGFEINDVGFQNAADCRALSTLALYKENKPGTLVRDWNSYVFANWSWNYDGDNTYAEYAGQAQGTFVNYWYASLRGEYYPGNFDDRLTRGGPLSRLPAGGTIRTTINSDSRKVYTMSLNGVESWDEAGGHLAQLSASLSVRPTSALRLLFEPGIKDLHDNAQYVQTVSDPLAVTTYGSRYVFATLHQTQLSLDTRLDWTFSPKLSLQLYLQPLIVSGGYQRFKELRAPRTYEFDVYGGHRGTIQPDSIGGFRVDPDAGGPAPSFHIDDPNFNFRSLRGNAVLRWEYRPGSALFLVWQQSREGSESFGDFELSRDWHGLFRIEPENVVAIKATYWLPL